MSREDMGALSGSRPSDGAASCTASPPSGFDPARIIDAAIVIASELGDDFDAIPYNKREWIDRRGGEPFRDVNQPFQCDYLAAASAVVRLLSGEAK